MAKVKKKEILTPEERLQAALVPDWEQPYKVPENWCWVYLLDSFENCTDSKKKIPKKKYLQNGDIAVVDQGYELIGGYTNDKEMAFAGNLPVIIFGDHTRCVKYIDFPFAQGADGVKVLKPKSFFNPKAFYYAFQSIDIPNMGYRRHFPLFAQYAIPVPPISEQQRIVNRIESLYSKLDEAKQKVKDALDSFETRKAAILHKAFIGELTAKWRKEHDVGMESWNNTTLSKIVVGFKYGTSEKSDYSYKGMPVFRIPNITDDGLSFENLKFLSHKNIPDENQIHENDILIIRSNGSRELVGKSVLVPRLDQEYTYASFLIRIQPLELVFPNYLVMYLNSSDARMQMFKKAKSSAGINNINSKELGAILIKLPSFPEQTEIVRILDDFLVKELQAKEVAEAVLEQIDLIKKSILARAFRSELGTNDPTEESAVELVKEVIEKSAEINNKPKTRTKRTVIPGEIKSALSNSNEEEIVRLLIKSVPKAVSVQMIMSISKKKFELMDALRSLEQKQIVIQNSLGEYLLKR